MVFELSPDRRVGRYVILDRIGAGGVTVVYAAYDAKLDRKVALKLLRAQHAETMQDKLQQELRQEAKAMAQLAHPNIVVVYDIDEIEGRVFISMEFVDGDTLKGWLGREVRTWEQVVGMFLETGQGLAAAHAAGLVHCDFKPANVLIGTDGRPRITDFGLVRLVDALRSGAPGLHAPDTGAAGRSSEVFNEGQADTEQPAGTPEYMAPEQHSRQPISPATDQFSFCVALHEALYGQRPFPGTSLPELGRNILEGRLRRIAANDMQGPDWLYAALLRGLQVEPKDRHRSMAALLTALREAPAPHPRSGATPYQGLAAPEEYPKLGLAD